MLFSVKYSYYLFNQEVYFKTELFITRVNSRLRNTIFLY